MTQETKNYIKEYYKNREGINLEELMQQIGSTNINTKEVQDLKRRIKRLQEEIDYASLKLSKEQDKNYDKSYTPFDHKILLNYRGRNASATFNLISGVVDYRESEDDTEYTLDTKVGEVMCVVGYNLELGLLVCKEYKYKINSDNTMIDLKPIRNIVISFMDNEVVDTNLNTNISRRVDNFYHYKLNDEKGKEFINKFYGVDYQGKIGLLDLRRYNQTCKSFEIIMKTAPTELVDKILKSYDWSKYETPMPIYKIMNIQKETYDKANERGVLPYLFNCIKLIKNNNNIDFLNKTEMEWLDIIDECKALEDDLKFYNIRMSSYYYEDDTLLKVLLDYYCSSAVLRKYYSFNKYMRYVVNETINQGYTQISSFVSELRDYLQMCDSDDIKPTLYSSYLKLTHDITSRNHNIKVEREGEEMFQNRYKDFVPFKYENYKVLAPTETKDLQNEGDNLNHCVASYIKRVIEGQCLIYFLRIDEEESLITLEVRNGDIVQVKGKHNRKPTEKESEVLVEFAKDRKLGVRF